jgi:hypothetical protein
VPTNCALCSWLPNYLEIEVEQRLLVTKAILFRKKPKVGRGREDERMREDDDETMRLCNCGGERVRSEDAEKRGGSSKQRCEQEV